MCSFGASVNNFYVLNLIYTYYTPIYKERMKERMKIKINIQYTTTTREVTYINKKINITNKPRRHMTATAFKT